MHFRIRIRIGGSIPERGSEGDRRRPSLFQEATAAAAECVKCEQDEEWKTKESLCNCSLQRWGRERVEWIGVA